MWILQYRTMVPAPQFVPAASQQFRPVAQGMPGPNIAMPAGQSQMPHFSQSTQQLPPISGQSGQVPPSSQAIPMPYVQASRPISSGPLPPQQNAQVPNNVPNLPGAAMPLSSSYTVRSQIYKEKLVYLHVDLLFDVSVLDCSLQHLMFRHQITSMLQFSINQQPLREYKPGQHLELRVYLLVHRWIRLHSNLWLPLWLFQ